MNGKTILVTGANGGIGREICRGLARQGASVVLAVRDVAKGEEAAADIKRDAPSADLHVMRVDLASLGDVRRFASAFRAEHPRLDVLVNNAGFHTSKLEITADGHESTFAVNHLAHFALTNELLPLLKTSAPSRVITVASEAHHGAKVDWADLEMREHWNGLRAYANSKLFNILFANELARRLEGTGVVSVSMHPGSVRTGWARGKESGLLRLGVALASPLLISAAKGADTAVWLASMEPPPTSGLYYYKRKERETTPLARDAAAARKLWDASETLGNAAAATQPPKR